MQRFHGLSLLVSSTRRDSESPDHESEAASSSIARGLGARPKEQDVVALAATVVRAAGADEDADEGDAVGRVVAPRQLHGRREQDASYVVEQSIQSSV